MRSSKRIVVIGGVACGCKAATRGRRLSPNLDITIVEQGSVLSHAGCGLPYYIQGMAYMEGGISTWPYGLRKSAQPASKGAGGNGSGNAA